MNGKNENITHYLSISGLTTWLCWHTRTHTLALHTWIWHRLDLDLEVSHPQGDGLVLKNLTLSSSVMSRTNCYTLVFILHSSKRPLTSLTKHMSWVRWSLSFTNIHRSHSKSFQFIYKKLNFPINCFWLFTSSNSSGLNTTICLDKTTYISTPHK